MRYILFLLMISVMIISCTGLYVEETPGEVYRDTSHTEELDRIGRKYREFDENFKYNVDELRLDEEKEVNLEDIWEK